jgi:hypothetical protein
MLPKLFNFGGPRLRNEVPHGFEGGVSMSQDPGAKELLGETAGRILKVRARTLRGLQIAEGVIHDVKTRCLPDAGNQMADIHRTDGWSYLKAQTYRNKEKSDAKLRDGPIADRARDMIKFKAGTCQAYGACTYVLMSERIRGLAADDPLRSRPLHLISDSEADHSYVVWGKRIGKGGRTGRFESEAIVIDPWPGLAKPFLRKESSKLMNKIDTVATQNLSTEGDHAQSFNLAGALGNADPQAAGAIRERIKAYLDARYDTNDEPKNREQIKKYLDGVEGVPSGGPELLEWVLREHGKKNFIDDRIVGVDDVSTRYVDKDGNYAAFDHRDPQYLQDFVNAHRIAKGSDFYQRAFPPEAPTEDDAPGGST